MVGKEGWLRVVEASISVLLIVGVLLSIPYSYDRAQDNRLEEQLQFAVNSIAENMSLRESILNYSVGETPEGANNLLILQKINQSLYNLLVESKPIIYFKICIANETCILEGYDKEESYSIERIITSSVSQNQFLPKKIKVIAFKGG